MNTATGLQFKITEMAERIKTLREIVGLSTEEMALKTGVTVEEYLACEAGESDLNFAFLYRCALALGVDVTEIIEGKSPRLAGYTVTRAGKGQEIQKAHSMTYYNLAASFKNRIAEPLYVVCDYNEKTANAIGKQAGVDEVIAGVLPDGKEKVIRRLKDKGKVIMVGDGINDAPALTRADIGIAIGAGTDIAIDSADIVLMKSRLLDVSAAIRLSRATLKNIHENLFWAFFYNAIGIPLAAGLFINLFGWELNPMFGAAAMSLSSFCVVSNALRLNFKDIHNSKKDKKIKSKIKEKKPMQITMKIEGMMCPHCEANVKATLEAIDGVASAEVSHVAGTAVVTLEKEVADAILKEAVEGKGYKVLA